MSPTAGGEYDEVNIQMLLFHSIQLTCIADVAGCTNNVRAAEGDKQYGRRPAERRSDITPLTAALQSWPRSSRDAPPQQLIQQHVTCRRLLFPSQNETAPRPYSRGSRSLPFAGSGYSAARR
ncbi:MAG: hypothetical protein R3C44_03550 [Chloroflexota bacterium]